MTVVVVGGGPAGCAAAAALGRRGHRAVVLEAGPPGKDKPCGDAYLPEAVTVLTRLGVDLGVDLGGSPPGDPAGFGDYAFEAISLRVGPVPVWRAPLGDAAGWVSPRASTDQRLRDAIADVCELRHGARVVDLRWAEGRWELWTASRGATADARTVTADALVIATGAGARLPALAGIERTCTIGASQTVYVDGAMPREPEFVFGDLPFAGYAWLFPFGEGRGNAGVCALTGAPAVLRPALTSFVTSRGLREVGRRRGGGGPMWSDRQHRMHDPRGAVVCGDAAGLVDPASGEGITAALTSGWRAGHAIADHVGGDLDALPRYSRELVADTRRRYAATGPRRLWRQLAASAAGPLIDVGAPHGSRAASG